MLPHCPGKVNNEDTKSQRLLCLGILVVILSMIPSVQAIDIVHRSTELDFARWVKSQQRPSSSHAVNTVHQTTMLAMSDGVRLYTSIYLPSENGQYPTILVRTPYNPAPDSYTYSGIADYYCPKGYAVVIQTIRGKLNSEGTYSLLSSGEIDDGFDTINWIPTQTWSNGIVGIMGVSHDGFDALAAGVRNPAALKIIIAGGAPADLRTDAFLVQGTVDTGLLDYIDFMTTETGQPYDTAFYQNYLNLVRTEPRVTMHDNIVEGVQLPIWDELVQQVSVPNSSYWQLHRIRDRFSGMQIPVVHIAGLSGDGDMPDTIQNYLTLASNPVTKKLQRLILGPWAHGGSVPLGDTKNVLPYLLERIDAYLDYYLQNKSSPLLQEKPVQFYSKGEAKWIYSNDYPVSTQTETFFLSSGGKLSKDSPTNSNPSSESYASNPTKVPSILNMQQVRPSSDQVVYLSDPLPKAIKLTGEATFRLFASSDVTDTDFYISFFQRKGSAEDELVATFVGRIDARFRKGSYSAPSLLQKGKVYEFDVRLYPISRSVQKGTRLGIAVLSNLDPYVVRNANTGNEFGFDTEFKTAHQRVYHSVQYPSALILTVH